MTTYRVIATLALEPMDGDGNPTNVLMRRGAPFQCNSINESTDTLERWGVAGQLKQIAQHTTFALSKVPGDQS